MVTRHYLLKYLHSLCVYTHGSFWAVYVFVLCFIYGPLNLHRHLL